MYNSLFWSISPPDAVTQGGFLVDIVDDDILNGHIPTLNSQLSTLNFHLPTLNSQLSLFNMAAVVVRLW